MKKELIKLVQNEIKAIKDAGEFNLMLSGGVDSSTLLALALDIGIKPDRLITVKLPYGDAHDEFSDTELVAEHFKLTDRLVVITLNNYDFLSVLTKASKVIGRPIPHYNIYPLYVAFEQLSEMGIKSVVVGDGPDESMCGYTRHIIMNYFFSSYNVESFEHYDGVIDKLMQFRSPIMAYANIIGKHTFEVNDIWNSDRSLVDNMCAVDMKLMRPDMMDMSHGLAHHFGIKIHAPYEKEIVDSFMFKLPFSSKIDTESQLGKYLLREIGHEHGVPHSVIWRKHKIGGPVVPVNKLAGWLDLDTYDKSRYLEFQKEAIVNG